MNGVTAIARMPEQLDVFWVGEDGRVYSSWWHQGLPWSGAFPIGGFFPAGAPIAAVARTPDHLDLFVVGNDGRVYTSWWHEGQPWSGVNDNWLPIGGFFPAGCSIAALARTQDHLDVFVIGNDGRVYTSWWHEGQNWSGINDNWLSLGGVFPSTAAVSAIARRPDQLDVFITGNDGRVYTSWWHEGQNWSGINDNWLSLGGFFPAGNPISVAARVPEQLDVFITGNDGRVYTSWWNPVSGWSGIGDNWLPIGGFFPVNAPVAALNRGPDHLDLFVVGNDGRVYTSWWHQGEAWSGGNDNWLPIGGFFPPATTVAALSRIPDHLDVFVTGNDKRIYSSFWHAGQPWSGANDNWFSINVPPGPRIHLQNLHVNQAQEDGIFSDGDEPYLVTLGFRSKFRTPGSTQVFWSGDLHELGHLDSGDSVDLPLSMGFVDFPGVQIMSRDNLLHLEFPEVFGAFTLCLESDATPFSLIHDQVERLRGALHGELERLVAGGELITDFSASAEQITREVQTKLAEAVQHVVDALNLSVGDAIVTWLRSFSDPDDFIDFHGFVFAGVDDSLASLLPPMSSPQLSIGPFKPGPVDFAFTGDDASYQVRGVISG